MALPVEPNALMLNGSADYRIERSVRLRASASAQFTRTPGSAGNLQRWTISFWMKRGALASSAFQNLFLSQTLGSSTNYAYFGVDYSSGFGNGVLVFEDFQTSSSRGLVKTNATFRDPAAWYHVVLTFDTPNATAADRIRIYVNGAAQTLSVTTQIAQNANGYMNSAVPHFIGSNNSNPSSNFFDGYLAEVNFIDGQSLTPSSFGQTDPITGVWVPKAYAGTYGTNGYYLKFTDNSGATATTIGKDFSGNSNNWTPTNVSVTSGTTYDSMLDSPTNYSDSGNGRGNYPVLNPLRNPTTATLSEGNLRMTASSGAEAYWNATLAYPSSGKWWFEFVSVSGPNIGGLGFRTADTIASMGTSSFFINEGGFIYTNGTAGTNIGSWTVGDSMGLAVDMDASTFRFYKNGVAMHTAVSFTKGTGTWFPFAGLFNASNVVNFGQRPFAFGPPSGFAALNTQNIPEPAIKKGSAYFDATTYTGTGASRSITGLGFSPDLVWIKGRSGATDHGIYDAVRGVQLQIESNNTDAETTQTTGLTAFNSDGFTIGALAQLNTNAATYAAWSWDEGATPGFDIVTGNIAPSTNFNHSLGIAPSLMIVRPRSGGTQALRWFVYHSALGATQWLSLSETTAAQTNSTVWDNTAPTSSQFTLGSGFTTANYGNTFVAYLWSEVPGFSRFGSYTGNGSADGPFVWCGFRPRWLMVKCATSGEAWQLFDTARSPENVANELLQPNSAGAEVTSFNAFDLLSNGFKVRDTNGGWNGNGATYVYAAFAENPFKIARAR